MNTIDVVVDDDITEGLKSSISLYLSNLYTLHNFEVVVRNVTVDYCEGNWRICSHAENIYIFNV